MEGTLKKFISVFCIVAIVAILHSQVPDMIKRAKASFYPGKYHESRRTFMGTLSSSPPHQKSKSSKKKASSGSYALAAADSNVAAPRSWPWSKNSSTTPSPSSPSSPSSPPPPGKPRNANIYPSPKRIDVGHIEGKGVGYNVGYTDLSIVFAPEYRVGHYLSLISVRGVVFDDGKLAANAGYIGRYLPKSFCEVLGFNVSYDFRQGHRGNYNQISGGFEVLNRRWEVHVNGSAPVGTKMHTKDHVFDNYVGPFKEVCRLIERAKYVVDGNVGYYMVNGKNFQLYAAAGPYYLWGHVHESTVSLRQSSWGGKALVRPQFWDIAAVELSVSYDHIFSTIYQVNLVMTVPLYKLSSRLKHKKGSCGVNNRQIYQPIDRDIVLTNRTCCTNNF
jgi:hypothetical protein